MNEELLKRIKTFAWGMGGFLVVAVGTYTMNLADIRDIDFWKILTIILTVASGYAVNQFTKIMNK
jgi:hypothetical protein